MAGGATEWVFFDPGRAERFAHLGDTLIPGSGKRWWHLHRQSRVPPSAPDGTGASNSGAGPTSESTQMRAAGSADDDDELPWQVIGIRDDRRLEELRRRGRQHATDTEAAAQRRDLIGHAYDDQFDVAMDGVAVQVARADLQSGWGMELSILCCNAAGRAALDGGGGVADAPAVDEATRTRVLGDNLYSVLLVPVDFTPGELKKTHRALSLRLHPDRAGGSTELFAKAAAAHDCLADEACRADFDAGTDVDSAASIKEQVERHYYAENYPFEPFGAVFENDDGDGARERGVRYRARQRQRAGWVEANASSVERAMPAPAGGDHSAKEEL